MLFRVPSGKFVAIVVSSQLAVLAALFYLADRSLSQALLFAAAFLPPDIVVAWLISRGQTIEISSNGLVLYRVNKTPWVEIVAAVPAKVLGLDYLKLRLKSGKTWWLPLFFHGEADMRTVLASSAPENHPVRMCLIGDQPR